MYAPFCLDLCPCHFYPFLSACLSPPSSQLLQHSLDLRTMLKRRDLEGAKILLANLERDTPLPNLVMYHMYIAALVKTGQLEEVMKVIEFLVCLL